MTYNFNLLLRGLTQTIKEQVNMARKCHVINIHRQDHPQQKSVILEHKDNHIYILAIIHIGVAPITQLRTCRIKIVTFKGGHLM